MKVKICGITSYEDAKLAIDLGADALGFNFVSASPRCISAVDAQLIVRRLPPSVWFVGVFADHSQSEVQLVARTASLDTLQFHGGETPEYCAQFTQWRVIKAFRFANVAGLAEAAKYENCAEYYLLDAFVSGQAGGTGKEISGEILQAAKSVLPRSWLAGGLTPENVAEKVKAYQPFGVDVASGVEISPGKKDPEKMRAFISAARSV